MYANATCIGKLCPDNLESLNVNSIVDKVILTPYVHENGFYVGLHSPASVPLTAKCTFKKPFDCAEKLLIKYEIPSRNVTHISFEKNKEMLIFIKLDQRLKFLDFVEVKDIPKESHKTEIQNVLNEEAEMGRGCVLCGHEAVEINVNDKYPKFVKKLGTGSYGIVKLLENNNGERVAVKHAHPRPSVHDIIYPDFLREVASLRALQGHPNIIKMLGFSVTKNIVLEVAEKSLSDALKDGYCGEGGESPLMTKIIFQIIKGMHYMNTVGIWHRDLKPQNILVFPGDVIKITDFGLSRGGPFQWISTTGVVYTLWYRAPEILLQEVINPVDSRHPSVYTSKAEVFSVGMCLWDLLNGNNKHSKLGYMHDGTVTLQLWKLIRGLGSEHFDWCVTNPFKGNTKCDYDVFVEKYALKRMTEVPDKRTLEEVKGELTKLPKTDFICLEVLDKVLSSKLSEGLQSLFKGLTHPDPNKRITMDEAIRHSYFKLLDPPMSTILSGEEIKQKQRDFLEKKPCKPIFMNVVHKHWEILTSWLLEVVENYTIFPATTSLTFQILRCYLKKKNIVSTNLLQPVGCACLYLATLYMEVTPLEPNELIYITDGVLTEKILKELTIDIFLNIGGLLHLPTPFLLFVDKVKDLNLTIDMVGEIVTAIFKDQISLKALEGRLTNEEIAEKHSQMARSMKASLNPRV